MGEKGNSEESSDQQTVAKLHYFAVPVEVGGEIFPAWFNVNELANGTGNTFYQLGIPTKEAAGKPTQSFAKPLDSTESQPALKVSDFLNGLNGNLAEKLENSIRTKISQW